MMITSLIDKYAAGPGLLLAALHEASRLDVDAYPVSDTWSIRETVCHLADSEIVYADRIKRVLAEDNPTFFEADPNIFVPALHVRERPLETELQLIGAVRSHMLPILRSLNMRDLQRSGQHSLDGQMTLETLLQRITNHIPHHLEFIKAKVAEMLK
jgi:uncharacterized damage-inducible protein DinB